jgi:4-amino-4-deoxy-L-arabinose transferase-like glycosyltransferase
MTRRQGWLLAGIIGAAAVVRFATLDHQSYDHDEAVTAWRVLNGGLGHMFHVVGTTERSPPLYYVLAWLWSKAFGTGEVGLRSLSALIGCLTIPAAYLAARELSGPRAGLVAAALVAFNPYLVWYSQEARSYALFVLFGAWGLYFFARCLSDPSTRNLWRWAAASGLAICSHYFAAFVVGAQGLWLAMRGWPRRGPIVALGATAAVGLALIPLAIAQEGTGRRNLFAGLSLARRAADTLFGYLASQEPGAFGGSRSILHFREAVVVAGLVLAAIAAWLLWRRATARERSGALVVAGAGAAAIAVPFALAAVGVDFVDPRNMIGSLVPFLVAAGIGLGCRGAGRLGTAAAIAAVLLFGVVLAAVYESGQLQRPDWRGAAAAMGAPSGPRVLVVARNGNEPIAYYRNAREFRPPHFHGERVNEIDVLSKRLVISPPGHGFRLVAKQGLAPCCVLWRYRAPRRTLVRPGEVADNRVLHEPSSVLVEGVR